MADIRSVDNRIAELRAQIAPMLREIELLEATKRVLRSLERGEPVVLDQHRPISDMTMPEAAELILSEHAGRSLHYKKITEMALARGFRGKRTDLSAPLDNIAASFRRMMGQRPDIFESVGDGEYRISESHLAKEGGV